MIQRDFSDLKKKNILVAGGSGLVGANLTRVLRDAGVNVLPTYFSRRPSFLEGNYKHFDFTKFDDCINATKGMDYVVMCAAKTSGVKLMKEEPTASLLPNLKINAGLLEACRINNVERIVFISSSTVYQEADYPIAEDQLDLNRPPYDLYFTVGWMNRYVEQLAKFYSKRYDMKIGIVRPASIYGPHDKFNDEYSNVIPALIKRALGKERPFIVWGDGSAVRDFIYIDDFIDDLLDVLDRYCVCEPLNLGSREGITIKAAVEAILDVCGHGIVPQYDKTKPTAIPYRMVSIKKFESIFGKKKRTAFKEGIIKTAEWYKSIMEPQFK
jgi:GDP-L-fucose synthase